MKKSYESGSGRCPVPKKLLLIMKLTAFLIILFTVQVTATVYSQNKKLSLNMQGNTIKEVLQQIEAQSEYRFIYENEKVNLDSKVSIRVKDEVVENILKQLFERDGVSYSITENNLILINPSGQQMKNMGRESNGAQQQKTVSGKVTDSSAAPLPGVSVVVKGTTTGVITDMDGNYTLPKVPENTTLVFSFVGMKTQEMTVGNKTTINVVLAEETIGIEEVVAVGYGTMKKSDLTGSVTRANIGSFKESSNVSLTQSLQGVVPGLNVGQVTAAGQDASISIRGRTTISGTTSPLIVLDGVIYRGNLVDISSQDIESIDVLKDASATAIYGSQASNGVLIITSKKGKDLGKPVVSYSGTYTYQLPSNTIRLGNSEDYINKIKTMYLNTAYLAPDYTKENPNFNVSTYLADKNAVDGYANGINTDWWNLTTNKSGQIQDHNLSITGKSQLSSYFFSVGYLDQSNILINDKYRRYNVRLNLENEITRWMKLGIQTFLTSSDLSGATASISDVQSLVPVAPAYDANNQLVQYPYKTYVNPLLQIQQDNLDKRLNLFGNFYADIDVPFIKGLNYRASFSQNLTLNRNYNFDKTASNFQGTGIKNNSYEYDWSLDNILTYKKNIKKHAINVTLVYGMESRENEGTNATAQIFQNDVLGYNALEAGQADQMLLSSSAWDEKSFYSMGRLHYAYNNKYFVTATLRRDAFSGFGANNKVGYFPSMALAWTISEESFLKENTPWLNQLKLRFSNGSNGNRTVGRYATLAKLSSATRYLYGDGGTPVMAQWVSSLANSDLKWEKTATSNLGIDFAVFNSRLSGSMDAYVGNTSDLLYNIDIPVVNGFGSIATNIGKMQNKGFELALNGTPVKQKDFRWDVALNFSMNRNKVVSINGTDVNKDGVEDNIISSDAGNSIIMGKPYGVWYDYDITGMWQIADAANIPTGFTFGTYKIRDISGPEGKPDGAWTAAYDRKIVGYKDPSYRFSVLNTLNYKRLELKIFVNSIQGGHSYYKAVAAGNWANIDNLKMLNSPGWDWWTPENPDAKYRKIGDYPKPVGENVHPYSSRSFIRLQDVSLSYSFDSGLLKKYGLRNCKVFVSGKNLKTWSNWEGWDPETGAGLTPGGVPVMKSYSVGLNVEF